MKTKTTEPPTQEPEDKTATHMPRVTTEQMPEAYKRRGLRVLTMVHELHKAGYQRLRICPGMSGSCCYWRCAVTPITNILKSHGATVKDGDGLVALYSSGQDNEYFGWRDAKTNKARELAAKFIERFPEIARDALGQDWNYVGWYVQMLGLAERGDFPIAYSNWYGELDPRWLPTTEGSFHGLPTESLLPMPPGGEA